MKSGNRRSFRSVFDSIPPFLTIFLAALIILIVGVSIAQLFILALIGGFIVFVFVVLGAVWLWFKQAEH
ncbi:hypothetical protein J4461_01835 [Candidatus Pacearchaeota archaeon]|nr:hypothetical protein [Candidatus Pacearchaeota archaeon]